MTSKLASVDTVTTRFRVFQLRNDGMMTLPTNNNINCNNNSNNNNEIKISINRHRNHAFWSLFVSLAKVQK